MSETDSPIIEIEPATRKGAKFIIDLFGLPQTGKTLSALKLMAGMEPDPNKRGMLDTEGGERGRLYSEEIEGSYMYGALTAPYTPERYIAAMMAFVKRGITTLVVDSSSHVWFAEGGILDIVEQSESRNPNQEAKWDKPKRRLGKVTQFWLGCGLHIILSTRGKQPLVDGPLGRNGKPTRVPGPVIPVQEKNLRFDLTIVAQMLGDGKFSVALEDGGKCPGALRGIFASGERINEDMGRRLIEWLGGQDGLRPEQRAVMLQGTEVAAKGSEAFRDWWNGPAKPFREFLRPKLANYQSIAATADAERAAAAADRAEAAEDEASHGDPFGRGGIVQAGGEDRHGEV